ncbi:MAG: hypothetical protein Tsb002_02930 [Wenzhouxiangellaceae bacterium]
MKVLVSHSDNPQAEVLRSHFADTFSRYYAGWDHDYDRRFDPQALWFSVRDQDDQLISAARLLFPYVKGKRLLLPLEVGQGDQPVLAAKSNTVCEGAGLYFVEKEHIDDIMNALMVWCHHNQVNNFYALVDAGYTALLEKYEGMEMRIVDGWIARFADITSRKRGTAVAWQPLVMDRKGLEKIWLENHRRYQFQIDPGAEAVLASLGFGEHQTGRDW